MENLQFLTWEELAVIHRDELVKYGGADGFIDENTVRAAFSRAEFTYKYDADADLADLAADYMFGIATTQGFVDGNKRTGLAAATVFLMKNGWMPIISPALLYLVAMAVAKGEVGKVELADIFRSHMEPYHEDDEP